MRFLLLIPALLLLSLDTVKQPLVGDFNQSAAYRWLNKKVLDSRVLDDMEKPDHWQPFTNGAQQVVDARKNVKSEEIDSVITQMLITGERYHSKSHALKIRIPTKLNRPGPTSGRGWGTAGVRRIFDHEDWTGSNRISVWIFPDNPGFYVNWLELRLYNDGKVKLPAPYGQEGETSIILKNHEWNHVVWEIGNVVRDRITAFEISYYLAGNEPEASDTATYFFDDLELQKVEPDYIEGWKVWPGRISYNQAGYEVGAGKFAIANDLEGSEFKLIDQQNNKTVFTKPVEITTSVLGSFEKMDFSEFQKEGTYILEAGNVQTHPFVIRKNAGRETILKALNFFYCERCGMAIPGVHGVCHRDWTCNHNGKSIIINGGWHDAGDLTQGLENTGEAVYAMFSLAESLKKRNYDPELYGRLVEEARWGLDWILKTSFHDGYRNGGSISSRRTDGIIGDFDDVSSTARNTPTDHFIAAAAEALAFRVLQDEDPRIASYSLAMAKEDWRFAVTGFDSAAIKESTDVFRGTFDSNNVRHELASDGIIAAVNLWEATGDKTYLDKAANWANIIVDSQQREYPAWDPSLTGFFYTGPDKKNILHYVHRGRDQAPIMALAALCRALPDHPDWMKWYSTVALYSKYLKATAEYTKPYDILPASVYTDKEYLLAPESRRESFRNQVLSGIPLGSGHYLRIFPVWMDYRGHYGTLLTKALALATAARLCNDPSSLKLAEEQMDWITGKNPFAQSTMYGEGYDYTPLYSPLSGNIVGALPVGIQSHGDSDIPYWPVQSTWTYKEVWVHPVACWIWLMKDLYGQPLVSGKASSTVKFQNLVSGVITNIEPDVTAGEFKVSLPQGKYLIQCDDMTDTCSFLPAENYSLDFRPGHFFSYYLSSSIGKNNEIKVTLHAGGYGAHNFNIRSDNLAVPDPDKKLTLKHGEITTVQWHCRIISGNAPWMVVVIPDHNFGQKKSID